MSRSNIYKDNICDKLLSFERGMRGGISSTLGDRHVKCYNKSVIILLEET